MSANENIRVVARLARAFETRLGEEASMSLPQFRVLAFLSDGDHAASVLADWLAVSRPSVTAMVDGLVEKGWVERTQSPVDRRKVLHQLTAAGHVTLDAAQRCLEGVMDTLLEHLDADEIATVEAGLGLLGTAMTRHREAVTQ